MTLPLLLRCCCAILACMLLAPAALAREAVADINDYGWKALAWGMSPEQARKALKNQKSSVTIREIPAMPLLSGYDLLWNQEEIPADALQPQAGGRLLATNYNGAILLFLNNSLFGVYISRSSPRHLQDSLFQSMVQRYPGARSRAQGPGRNNFQHFAGNRRIVWQGRPTGFTLAFYDTSRMPAPAETPLSSAAAPRLSGEFEALPAAAPTPRTSSRPPAAPDGRTWTEPGSGLQFLRLSGGCFMRYSPRLKEPQEICVDPFWMSVHEVSEAALASCTAWTWEPPAEDLSEMEPAPDAAMERVSELASELTEAGPSQLPQKAAPAQGEAATAQEPPAPVGPQPSDKLPAVGMSRARALDFCDCLDRKHPGRDFALPTAAQWEMAARAGTGGTAPWPGYAAACGFGNFADRNAAKAASGDDVFPCEDGHAERAPVGSYKPNAWGLYDLLGNVWEWCFPSQHDMDMDFAACGEGFRGKPDKTGFFSRLRMPPESGRDDLGLRLVMRETGAQQLAAPYAPALRAPSAYAQEGAPQQHWPQERPTLGQERWETAPPVVGPGKRPAIEDLM